MTSDLNIFIIVAVSVSVVTIILMIGARNNRPVKPYNPFAKDELQLLPTISLTQSNIDALNSSKTEADDEGRKSLETDDGNLRYASPECSICLVSYEVADTVRVLSCSHTYHAECIDVWLTQRSSRCPICKLDIRQALGFEHRTLAEKPSADEPRENADATIGVPPQPQQQQQHSHVIDITPPPPAVLPT
ncbi:hypothetical protein GGI15_001127 [Coemansia interrupta]|uniref:RING-type domain-containing protein n=1 Tax=Coemansia interrupta TaxID=1126814 RepID=A0A9W8LMU5_9FUNG|nr:hypothetical protein GGI15_001127 [Coemansia interrupta]